MTATLLCCLAPLLCVQPPNDQRPAVVRERPRPAESYVAAQADWGRFRQTAAQGDDAADSADSAGSVRPAVPLNSAGPVDSTERFGSAGAAFGGAGPTLPGGAGDVYRAPMPPYLPGEPVYGQVEPMFLDGAGCGCGSVDDLQRMWACDDDNGSLILGLDLLFLRPQFDQPSLFRVERPGGGGQPALRRGGTFDYDFDAGTVLWGHYVTPSAIGFRARWLQFDHGYAETFRDDGDGFAVTAAPLGFGLVTTGTAERPTTLVTEGGLDVYSFDLDVTKSLHVGPLDLLYHGGIRYAHTSQDFDFREDGVPGDVFRSGHHFNGFGPTIGVEDSLPMSESLSLTGSLRAAVLFGNGTQRVDVVAADGTPLAVGREDWDDVTPQLELRVGAEYRRRVGTMFVFFRPEMTGMAWMGVGNAARTGSAVGLGQAGVSTDTLGLYGVSLSAGVIW